MISDINFDWSDRSYTNRSDKSYEFDGSYGSVRSDRSDRFRSDGSERPNRSDGSDRPDWYDQSDM